jgi:hypothetical protein
MPWALGFECIKPIAQNDDRAARCMIYCPRLQPKQQACPQKEANMKAVQSKDYDKCSSRSSSSSRSSGDCSSFDNFMSYLSGVIPPPSLRAPSPATDRLASNACIGTGNGSPPWDIELAVILDPPLDPSSATQPPLNGCDEWDANRSAPAYQRGNKWSWDDASPPPSAPPLDLLLEDTYFEETGGRELNCPTPTSHTLAHSNGGCAGMRIRSNPEPIKLNAALQEHQPFPPPETKLAAVPIC